MKLLHVSLLFCAVVFASANIFCDASVAPAAAKAGFTFATIDISKIIDPQDPTKSQSQEWKDSMASFQKEIEGQQAPLQTLQNKIEAEKTKLEAKQKEGKQLTKEEQSSIMTMFQELQSKTQQLQQTAEAKFATLQKDFKAKIDAAVKAVADKKAYDVVMYKDVVVYAKSAVDITAEVVTELNNKHAASKRAQKLEAPKKA